VCPTCHPVFHFANAASEKTAARLKQFDDAKQVRESLYMTADSRVENREQTSSEYWVEDWTPPEKFWGDPIAKMTRWTPCKPVQGEFKVGEEKQLRTISNKRLKWTPSLKATLRWLGVSAFFLPLLPVGLVFICGPWVMAYLNRAPAALLLALIGTPLGILCVVIPLGPLWRLHTLTCPVIFDRDRGNYLVKQGAVTASADDHSISPGRARRGKLPDIHALQIIGERLMEKVPSGDTYTEWHDGKQRTRMKYRGQGFVGYELNLVLTSGQRVNVVDHADLAMIREEASTLATFLDAPVWDDSSRGTWKFEVLVSPSSLYEFCKMFWQTAIKKQRAEYGCWVWHEL